ncbi:helix-hairpin-helix domain-containing protein [Nocardia sp. NBC_00881]|uniref:helix-hairpin-helix domain-containing protein n=1 Tax=Nocardia sp. NBC_00881 TaxID=2975995 RepID=UPI003862D7D5|nr:helix-hairpin-helix domain-containing protein [Nocardia sp. NBC_00881]
MSRQDERERVRRRLGALTAQIGASGTAGAGIRAAGPPAGLGQWDLEQLPADLDPAEENEREVCRVRSPGWLEEPVAGSGWRDRLVPVRFRGVRLDPGRRGVRALVVVGLAAMAVAAVVVFRERPIAQVVPPLPAIRPTAASRPAAVLSASMAAPPGALPVHTDPGQSATELVVSVVGLVHHTGLVRLPGGSRVADAIAAAGGPIDGADTSGLNLAQRLSDGDQVLVGPVTPNPGLPQPGSSTISAGGRPPSGSSSSSGRPSGPAARVDLNTASETELDALPGVGPVTARAIVSWRTTNGRFTSVEQLGEVEGIGPARLARLRDLVTV